MKRIALALILTCVLSTAAFAGDIPTAGVVATPPPVTQSASVVTTVLLTILGMIRL